MPSDSEKQKYVDPEVERFVRENKEMVERLLKEEREKAKEVYEKGTASAEEFISYHGEKAKEVYNTEKALLTDFAEYQKKKAQEAVGGVIAMVNDPDVQKHFMYAGLELMMAIDALIKAAPLPDFMREAAEKAKETRDTASKAYCEKNENCNARKKQQAEKIPIDSPEKVEVE